MDLTQYVDNLRQELAVAAESGGEEARALAERLTAPLESATRLTLMEALSAAASEITRDLAPGSVDVRLRGRDPEFVVTPPPTHQPFDDAVAVGDTGQSLPAAPEIADDGTTTRINLRLPENLKHRIEEAAGRDQLSVNAWLVRAAASALAPTISAPRSGLRGSGGAQRYTGWVQ